MCKTVGYIDLHWEVLVHSVPRVNIPIVCPRWLHPSENVNNFAILRATLAGYAPFKSARRETWCILNLETIAVIESSKQKNLYIRNGIPFAFWSISTLTVLAYTMFLPIIRVILHMTSHECNQPAHANNHTFMAYKYLIHTVNSTCILWRVLSWKQDT